MRFVFNGRAGQKGPNALKEFFFLLRASSVAVFRTFEARLASGGRRTPATRLQSCVETDVGAEPPTRSQRPEAAMHVQHKRTATYRWTIMRRRREGNQSSPVMSDWFLLAQVIILLPLFFPWPVPTSSAGRLNAKAFAFTATDPGRCG